MKRLRIIALLLATILIAQEVIFPVDTMAISDPNRLMRQNAWAIDDECGTPAADNATSSSSLQQIADEAVSEGKSKNLIVAIKVSGDQTASAGESGQMPSASVIKLLVAAALAKRGVPLESVSGDLMLMIRDSNNEAANRLIDKAGGFASINDTANELGIGSDAHIGRKMLEAAAGTDPNTISAKGSDALLNEIKQSANGSGKIDKSYAAAIVDAMKAQTVNTKWGASGIPVGNMAHKTGELGSVQHDVGFFIKDNKWLTVTTMTNGGDGTEGIALIKITAKKLYDAWTGANTSSSQTLSESSSGGSASCCADPSASRVALAGNNNVEKILNFYMRKGLNLAQASGIVGNMMQESGLKPNIVQGGKLIGENENYKLQNGVGFGLVQWTFTGRQKPLQDHINKMGVKNTDLGGQLSFTWVELTGPYLSTLNNLKRTNDPVQAAVVVHDGYESSADSDATVRSVRGGNAKKVYDTYKNAPALAGSTAETKMNNPTGEEKVDEHGQAKTETVANSEEDTSGTGGCGSFAGGNFAETLKAYAWPTYKGNDIKPTNTYASAVKKAMGQGLYVGGIAYKGIDCGGFVTLLVRDSGYDKGYNYNGKGGPTSSQEAWMKQHWQSLGTSSSISASKLQPGDVAVNSTHTFIYVGDVPGFKAKIASASLDERAPMADNQQSPTQPGYNWYRKK